MAKSSKKKSKTVTTKRKFLEIAPSISDHQEFPPLTQSNGDNVDQLSERPPKKAMNAEDFGYVCIRGTTYFGDAAPETSDRASDTADTIEEKIELCDTLRFYAKPTARMNIQIAARQSLLDPSVCSPITFWTSDDWEQRGFLEEESGVIGGKTTWIFLTKNTSTDECHATRRICGLELRNEKPIAICAAWNKIEHPNVVRLQRIQTTRQFEDRSLLFSYEFHPRARNIHQFLEANPSGITIDLVWNFVCQLINGLRHIHGMNLAARILNVKSILMTGLDECTLKINNVGITEVLESHDEPSTRYDQFYTPRASEDHQKDDLKLLGSLIQSLAEHLVGCGSRRMKQLEDFAKSLSAGEFKTVDQAASRIPVYFLEFSSLLSSQKEVLQNEITKEVDNGRLFRLITMINRIVHQARTDYTMNQEHATIVLLFNDYLYGPSSLSHEISCLNKLDVGSQELIILHGTGKQASCQTLIVSFADLKAIFEACANKPNINLAECISCKQSPYSPTDTPKMAGYTFSDCQHSMIRSEDFMYMDMMQAYPTTFM